MVEYNDLVAGQGARGFRDGSFISALFDTPQGLAVDAKGTRLFVADAENHRIRVVGLDKNNEVQTLAGSSIRGNKDGSFPKTTFNKPSLLVFLPTNQLVVYDQGRLRLVNLNTQMVSTLHPKTSDGSVLDTIADVGDMIFFPEENSIYFTRSGEGIVSKLDMEKQLFSNVVQGRLEMTHPWGICVYGNHVCVGDGVSNAVYELEPGAGTLTAQVAISMVGKSVTPISAIASSGDVLYGLPWGQGNDWVQIAPANEAGPLKMMSVWGDFIQDKGEPDLSVLMNYIPYLPGFVADPADPKRFFVSMSNRNVIFSLRDYRFDKYKDTDFVWDRRTAGGITDFDFPAAKPPNTFRILIVGDSHTVHTNSDEYKKRWDWGYNRMETFPKRLEQMLNTWGALEDVPVHFQVLSLGRDGTFFLGLWPYYEVPPVLQTYDIDLCLLVMTPSTEDQYKPYFFSPLTKDGIPGENVDTEFFLKPLDQRAEESPVLKDFYHRCIENHFGKAGNLETFVPMDQMLGDGDVREDLIQLVGKPSVLLGKKIEKMKTKDGKPMMFGLWFLPIGNIGDSEYPNEPYRLFWKDVCARSGLSFMDLTDQMSVLKASSYPTAEHGGIYHFNHNGHTLLGTIFAHELIHQKLIPFESQTSK